MSIPIRFLVLGFLFCSQVLVIKADDKASLTLVRKLRDHIKNDQTNSSFKEMMDNKVMKEHTLSSYDVDQVYFYSDNPSVIVSIVSLVLENPEGVIDETTETGILRVYREFDYSKEIAPLFDFFGTEKKTLRKFQNTYLGQTISGPTNKVEVALKIKGDEQNEDTLEKRLVYKRNNIRYLDAYPVEGSSPKPKPTEPSPQGQTSKGDPEGDSPEQSQDTDGG